VTTGSCRPPRGPGTAQTDRANAGSTCRGSTSTRPRACHNQRGVVVDGKRTGVSTATVFITCRDVLHGRPGGADADTIPQYGQPAATKRNDPDILPSNPTSACDRGNTQLPSGQRGDSTSKTPPSPDHGAQGNTRPHRSPASKRSKNNLSAAPATMHRGLPGDIMSRPALRPPDARPNNNVIATATSPTASIPTPPGVNTPTCVARPMWRWHTEPETPDNPPRELEFRLDTLGARQSGTDRNQFVEVNDPITRPCATGSWDPQ